MHNITLICTRHLGEGNCNSSGLLSIIESVRPDIIFEELSQENFFRAYDANTLITLETSAIKMYQLTHSITHIPVDTFERPHRYDEEVSRMIERLSSHASSESFQLRSFINGELRPLIAAHGFHFLNSYINDQCIAHLAALKEKVLEKLNNEHLNQTYQLEIDVIDKREDEILNNIYNYSMENEYRNALMFIGSGHRKSIIRKIKEFNKRSDLKLNWTVFTSPYFKETQAAQA